MISMLARQKMQSTCDTMSCLYQWRIQKRPRGYVPQTHDRLKKSCELQSSTLAMIKFVALLLLIIPGSSVASSAGNSAFDCATVSLECQGRCTGGQDLDVLQCKSKYSNGTQNAPCKICKK